MLAAPGAAAGEAEQADAPAAAGIRAAAAEEGAALRHDEERRESCDTRLCLGVSRRQLRAALHALSGWLAGCLLSSTTS